MVRRAFAAAILAAATSGSPVGAQQWSESPFFAFEWEGNLTADVALADVDGDGDLDVLAANGRHWAQQDFVYFNNGDGRLLEALPIGRGKGASYAVRAIDLDRDGDLDAVVVRDTLPSQIFHNDGTGHFTFVENAEGSGGPARGALVLDANGDGIDDLMVFRRRHGSLLFVGNGVGRLLPAEPVPAPGDGATSGDAGDLDGDGDIDVVVARRDGNASIVLVNDGTGRFSARTLHGSLGDYRKAAIADLNGDGVLDVLLGGQSGLMAFRGKGGLEFSEPRAVGAFEQAIQALAIGDFDGDGAKDVAAGTEGVNAVLVNDGTGSFRQADLAGGEADTYGLSVGDMNGDGRDDLVIANSESENLVLRNRGSKIP